MILPIFIDKTMKMSYEVCSNIPNPHYNPTVMQKWENGKITVVGMKKMQFGLKI